MDLPKGSESMGLLPKDADILPATDDRIFKTVLTSPEAKPFLMKLIAGLIGRGLVDVTVHGNEIGISDPQEKMERFDVNCKTDDGSQINMEMQASRMEEDAGGEHKNLKARSIYFLCDLHASQPGKGERRYDKLARTYQVTFCSYTVFPHRKDYLNSFSMRHDVDNELLHDAIQTIIVELSKLGEVLKKPVDDMADLEKFSVFFEYAANPAYRDIVNKVIESEEVLTVASNLLMNISQDENERAIFLSRKKARMDYASDIATAEDRGREEKALAIAEKMLLRNRPVDEIAEDTGLTIEEVDGLKRQLFQ
jgi:predicted transposase/invertase (TIGR01784 family)